MRKKRAGKSLKKRKKTKFVKKWVNEKEIIEIEEEDEGQNK